MVVLGLLAGLVGSVVAGASAVALRTATAYDRLVAATHLDDARVLVFSDDIDVDRIARFPGVTESWQSQQVIGQLLGPRGGLPQRVERAAPAGRDLLAGRARGPGAARRPGRRGARAVGARPGDRAARRRPAADQAADPAGGDPVRHRVRRAGRAAAGPAGRRHRAGRAHLGRRRRRPGHRDTRAAEGVPGQPARPQHPGPAGRRAGRGAGLRPAGAPPRRRGPRPATPGRSSGRCRRPTRRPRPTPR